MLNTYPIWKYAIVVFATVLGVVYALPNVYPPDYAVQLSAEKSGVVLEERLLVAEALGSSRSSTVS